eukprot:Opistho-2@31501
MADPAPAPVNEPDWLRLQKKIFSRYIEQRLKIGGTKVKVSNIIEDLKDGVLLVQLIESLSGKTYAVKPKPAKARIQQIDQVSKIFEWITKEIGVKSTAQATDIVDGNEKSVLGLIFQIIIRYMKLDEEDQQSGDIKEALLLWLRNKTAGYANVKIDNLTKSFHDGLAFNALIHRMRPKLIPFDTLTKEDKVKNITLALDTAAKYCNLEKYLEPADVPHLDELGSVVYLYDWYSAIIYLQKQDIAARRIGKLADMTKLHDSLKAEYNQGAATLSQWLEGKVKVLSDRTIDNSMAGIKGRLAAFYEYKSKEKSDKIVVSLDLNALFDNLALRLSNNKRPPFNPANGLTPAAFDERFLALERAEAEASVALHAELERQIKLDKLSKRFQADAQNLNSYFAEKRAYLSKAEQVDSVDICQYHLETFALYDADFQNTKNSRVAALSKISQQLTAEKYEFIATISDTQSNIDGTIAELSQLAASKKQTLETELEKQKTINDNLCREFATAAKGFVDWLNASKQSISARGGSLEDQLSNVDGIIAGHAQGDVKLAEIDAIDAKIQQRQITNNPHTSITVQDAKAQWYQYQLLLKKKKTLLEAEIENSKRAGLSADQLKEINDNFAYFDKNGNKSLDRKELKACLQSLGEEATPADLTRILAEYDKDGDGHIAQSEFVEFMIKKLGDTNTQEEILNAFSLLAYEKDHVNAEFLDSVVNDLTFKQHHVEYLQAEMKPLSDGYDYKTWTSEVFAR